MGLFDRVRALLDPPAAPDLEVEMPAGASYVDAHASPRARKSVRDIDPNDLGGGRMREGGYRRSAQALVNMFTGQGTARDPTSFNQWAIPRTLDYAERFGMGRNALIQQALGKLPDTATREGWRTVITDPTVEDKQGVSDTIAAYEAKLNLPQRINRALFRGRQHGRAMVVLGIDDGRMFSEPVDPEVSPIRTILWAVTIDSRDFYPYKLAGYDSEHYGGVEQFQITDVNGILEDGLRYGENSISFSHDEWSTIFEDQKAKQGGRMIVHADRVLYFPTSDYFSLLDSLQDSLGAYFESMNGIRTAARESSLVKYKIGKLKQKMWSANAALAQEHMSLMQRAKSVLNAIVVGDDEDVEFVNRSMAGVADLSNPFMVWVAAALRYPITIFWGTSPGGFGKGEAERATFHEDVNALQDQVITPQLTRAHGYILVAQDGAQLPMSTQRKIEYNDLTPPDEAQLSKLRNEALVELRALADAGYITRTELRTAVGQLGDEFFRLELDTEFIDKPSPAQVGIFTGSIELLTSLFGEGNIPPEAGRALLLALDPVHFNADNIPNIIPIETPAPPTVDPQVPTLPGQEPPGGLLPADEEDSDLLVEVEPSEVDIVWSQAEPPADAAVAKTLAEHPDLEGVTSRQITLLGTRGDVPSYRGRGFGKAPFYSLEEVKAALLRRQGHMPAAETETETETVTDVGTRSLFVSFKLPQHLAQWVPYKATDTSPPHITLSYTKDVPPSALADVLEELRETFAVYDPIDVRVVGKPVQYFDNEDKRVAFARAEFFAAQELFDDIKEGLASFGYSVSEHGDFTPHVTLAYLTPGEDYTGPAPDGSWDASEAEVYYGGELVATFPLEGRVVVAADGTRDKGPLITEGYIWRTQRDSKVRSSHAKLEGRRFKRGTGDPTEGEPGDAPNCRCARETIVGPKATKRARASASRTVRRALRQNFKRVSGKATKDAHAPTEELVLRWLREHYSMAPKLTRPRIRTLLALKDTYAYLVPPEQEFVYRGLSNLKPSRAGKLTGETNPVLDKSWTTDFEQAKKFAAGAYLPPGSVDTSRVGAVLIARPQPDKMVLNANAIAEIPAVADHFNEIWKETLAASIVNEQEVVVIGSLIVERVEVVPMGGGEARVSDSIAMLQLAQRVVDDEWSTHNVYAHPLMQLLVESGAVEAAEQLHALTIPGSALGDVSAFAQWLRTVISNLVKSSVV